VLPSLSLSWALSETQSLRVSATRTLSRPEYRELSPIAYADEGGDNELRGNPGLVRALIENYDVRWERYPSASEVLSVSLFAKRFHDPIERVYQATTGRPTIGFTNAKGATNYGIELDARKNLGLLGGWAQPFTAFANATAMQSRIEIGDELTAATNPNRAMVGQAPYVVNTGLTWTNLDGGVSATVLYNVVGKRIALAGVDPLPDTYEMPRHVLDLSLQLPVWAGVTARVNARNLLDAPYVEQTGSLVRRRYVTGRGVSVGLGWRP
jgi:outer membrane receptor protein involved in Fe transport